MALVPISQITPLFNSVNLISYWKMDGNSNDSKSSNNGTDTSISYSAGKFTDSAQFNASGDQISCGTSNTLNLTTFAFSGWVYPTTPAVDFSRILDRHTGTSAGYRIMMRSTSRNIIVGSGTEVESSASLALNSWQNLIINCNAGSITIYINGVLANTISITMAGSSGLAFLMGSDGTGTDREWRGGFDDFAMFDRVLTAEEIGWISTDYSAVEVLPSNLFLMF